MEYKESQILDYVIYGWFLNQATIFTQLIEVRIQKRFVSICDQRPGKKLALEIEAGRI